MFNMGFIRFYMGHKKNNKPFEVKFFLLNEENEEYELFLAPFAGKKGPFAKKLLLNRIRTPINVSQHEETQEPARQL